VITDLCLSRAFADLKRYQNDWCMCYQEGLNCGDCKTCIALQLAVCCCECRCGLPTDSTKTVPWIVNLLGFNMWYQWSFPCSCLSSIGELKDMTAADEPWCCPATCGSGDASAGGKDVVTAQPGASEASVDTQPVRAEAS
jgi:hypothetical protein